MLKVKANEVPEIKNKTYGKYVYLSLVSIFSSAFLTLKARVSVRSSGYRN
jgi:hypothetical protein